jgi:hypothetical protein
MVIFWGDPGPGGEELFVLSENRRNFWMRERGPNFINKTFDHESLGSFQKKRFLLFFAMIIKSRARLDGKSLRPWRTESFSALRFFHLFIASDEGQKNCWQTKKKRKIAQLSLGVSPFPLHSTKFLQIFRFFARAWQSRIFSFIVLNMLLLIPSDS